MADEGRSWDRDQEGGPSICPVALSYLGSRKRDPGVLQKALAGGGVGAKRPGGGEGTPSPFLQQGRAWASTTAAARTGRRVSGHTGPCRPE